ncbi:hypothetical protein H0H92_005377 [Tricholoma furcatifolium]|nr:hypothetical protein H0H92_005377 [Tricholoma furcatifolium]
MIQVVEDSPSLFRYSPPYLPSTPSSSFVTSLLPTTPSSTPNLASFSAHRSNDPPPAEFSVTSPLTETPPTPPSPIAQAHMEGRADLIAGLPTFDSGKDIGKENPRAFIVKVRRTFLLSGLTDEQKIAVFELFLIEGGPAQECLTAAFNALWPARAVVAKTTAKKQDDDLRQHRLTEKDLLQKQELMDSREAYSHIVWAEKALRLARLIPDTNHLLISQSKAKLPQALQDCLSDDCDTWEGFTTAVKNVRITKLWEKIKRKEEEDALKRKVKSLKSAARQTQPQTPSKLLANTLSRTDQEKWEIISCLPDPLADTPANCTLYRDRVAQWHCENPTLNVPTEDRPYPCMPGTAQLGSGECLGCGHLGHLAAACIAETKIPDYESRWRQKVNFIRRDATTPRTVGINLVNAGTAFALTQEQLVSLIEEHVREVLEKQGKGQGLSN